MTGTRSDAEQVRITPEEITDARWWTDAREAERVGEWFVVIVLAAPEVVADDVAERLRMGDTEFPRRMIRYLDRWAFLVRMNTATGMRYLVSRWVQAMPGIGVGVADSRIRGERGAGCRDTMPLDDMLAVAYAESLVCRTSA